jgi:hypothetical protein
LAQLYYLIKYGDRRVLAIPISTYIFNLRYILKYKGQTLRSNFLKYSILLIFALCVERLFFRVVSNPLDNTGFGLNEWLGYISKSLGCSDLKAMIVWPKRNKRGRFYAHLFKADGTDIGFAKISLDDYSSVALKRESRALELLCLRACSTFLFPKKMLEGEFNGEAFLITEPLGQRFTGVANRLNAFPASAVQELSFNSIKLSKQNIAETIWWNEYENKLPSNNDFIEDLKEGISDGLESCFVHGDLGPGNIFRWEQKLYILDWENFDEKGPYLVDSISYWLAVNQAKILAAPLAGRDRLIKYSQVKLKASHEDIIAALAFLHAKGILAAEAIINQWKK